MRSLLIAVAALAAISWSPSPSQANILGLFGFDCSGEHNCGCRCGSHGNCGNCCEPACGCGCGECCEPACGCGSGCYANGRQYAGQKFDCCCQSRAPICPCVNRGGCGCGTSCGCGDCCEPACGCGGCGEPCGAPCHSHRCCLKHCGFCSGCGHLINALCCGRSSCGCNGEMYWSEWHNDPPYCNDPCNCQGEWIGPSGGPYNGSCGCDGGYSGAQSHPVYNGSAYAKQSATNRSRWRTMSARLSPHTKRVRHTPARSSISRRMCGQRRGRRPIACHRQTATTARRRGQSCGNVFGAGGHCWPATAGLGNLSSSAADCVELAA